MNRFATPVEIKTLFALVLASLLISSLAQRYLGHPGSGANVDFYVYYFAAQAVHENPHADLYTGATTENPEFSLEAPAGSAVAAHAKAAGFNDVSFYVYPPLLADLLSPFSHLPPRLAAALWRAFNLSLVLASVLLLARMLRLPVLSFEFVALAVAAYSFWPVNEAVADGQITIVLFALWTVGVVAYSDGRVVLSAAAFALATALKVTPILVLPLFLVWKDRRWLLSYLGVSLGLVSAMAAVNGLHTVAIYPTVMSTMGGGIPAMSNKSIGSLLTWIYCGRIFTIDAAQGVMPSLPRALAIAAKAVSGVFYLACLFLAWRSRHRLDRESKAIAIAVFGLVIACVSPVSWRNGYSAAFIVLAILWVKALRTPPRILPAVLLALTTFTLGSLFFDLAAQAPLPELCRILLSATWIVFSVLFCVYTLFHVDAGGRAGVATDPSADGAGAS